MRRTSAIGRLKPLLVATAAVIALPFLLRAFGLSLNTGTWIVGLAIATMGLNLCIGYTGLVSFGHSAWFGIGAYAAGLIQLRVFPDEIWLPLLGSMVVVAIASSVIGMLILRRRGVYFSLLTLALAALVYTTAFRWTNLTGGEDGLGGLKRGAIGPISLDSALNYYMVVAAVGLVVLYVLMRLVRSPFGHVLVAIRENQLRAGFQGYPVERYKLAVFVISAVVTGLAGGLIGFLNYLVSAEAVSVPFAGEPPGDGRDRRHAQPARTRARGAVLHPVPRAVLDLDVGLAVLVRPHLRGLRDVFARRPRRHRRADHAATASAGGGDRCDEPPQDL
ncbi:branched-chain amino acid ABC transporter permease [Bradyrhizobium guangxiense]